MNDQLRDRQALVERLLTSARYKQTKGKVRTYKCNLDADDLEGELNVGIVRAMHSVKFNIGDPMEFLLHAGYRHVQRVVRMDLNHSLFEECVKCKKWRPYRPNPCYTCGGKDFILHPRFVAKLMEDIEARLISLRRGRRTKSMLEGNDPQGGFDE